MPEIFGKWTLTYNEWEWYEMIIWFYLNRNLNKKTNQQQKTKKTNKTKKNKTKQKYNGRPQEEKKSIHQIIPLSTFVSISCDISEKQTLQYFLKYKSLTNQTKYCTKTIHIC